MTTTPVPDAVENPEGPEAADVLTSGDYWRKVMAIPSGFMAVLPIGFIGGLAYVWADDAKPEALAEWVSTSQHPDAYVHALVAVLIARGSFLAALAGFSAAFAKVTQNLLLPAHVLIRLEAARHSGKGGQGPAEDTSLLPGGLSARVGPVEMAARMKRGEGSEGS